MTKECWLFLDCQEMTGYPPSECPNYENCKHNALHAENRSCKLPYTRHLPKENDFLPTEPYLRVDNDSDAIEAGWQRPSDLFYELHLEKKILEVSDELYPIPIEAKQLGFEAPQLLPYYYCDEKKELRVTQYVLDDREMANFISAGWHSAIELPYRHIYCCREKRNIGLEVEREELGWFPAEPLESDEWDM